MSEIRLLNEIDADEVSPVRRGANRKGVVLKGEEDAMALDSEVADILSVPWAHEGAMLDFLRKEGVDEAIQKSMIGGLRLLAGASEELPREVQELVEKLGSEMYARVNRPLNTSHGDGNGGQLSGTASGVDVDSSVSGPRMDGSASGTSLEGTATAAPTNKTDSDAYDADEKADDDWVSKDFTADDRARMAGNGQALPDGSFPIPDADHLHRAIKALGRGKNNSKSKIKAHIIARAKALGMSSAIPDTWVQKESPVEKALRVLKEAVMGNSQAGAPSTPEDNGDDVDDGSGSGQDDTAVNKGGTVDTHVAVPIKKEDGSWDYSGVPAEAVDFYRATVEKADAAEARLVLAEERIAKAEDDKLTRTVVAKAEGLTFVGATDDLAEILKAASEKLEPEQVEKLEQILTGANERISKSKLFEELGAKHIVGGESPGDAWSKIEKMADDLVEKAGDGMTRDKAIDTVLKSNEGKRLYEEFSTQQLAAGMGGVV